MYNVNDGRGEDISNQKDGKEQEEIIPNWNKSKLTVSFSELSEYLKCPHKWNLLYAQGFKVREPSIHTIFGTAIHNTIQHYLQVMYEISIKKADEINFVEMLSDELHTIIEKEYGDDDVDLDVDEVREFYMDGLEILKNFKSKRHLFFPKKGYELVGIEVPISYNLIEFKEINKKLNFIGFADVIIKDTTNNTYKIIDIKTATRAWGKYKKNDKITRSQIVYYKIFFSKMFNVSIDDIEVEYFIVKRKINTDLEFPEKRIQIFEPANGKTTQREIVKWMKELFLDNVYNPQATRPEEIMNPNANLPKIGGHGRSNCKFCVFKNDFEKCNKIGIVEEVNNFVQYNSKFEKRIEK